MAALLAFVDKAAIAPQTVDAVMPGIVAKLFLSARNKTMGFDVVMMYLEVCSDRTALHEHIITGSKNKKPAMVASSVELLLMALKAFGPRVIPPRLLTANLVSWFNSNDKKVRKAAQGVAVELFKWGGSVLFDVTETNLRAAQKDAIEKELAKVTECSAKPERFPRSAKVGSPGFRRPSASNAEPEEPFDPLSCVDPVDVFKELDADWAEKIKKAKWMQVKDMLQDLQNLMKPHPKLLPNPILHSIMAAFKKLLKHSNVNVISYTLAALVPLAKGLRVEFSSFARRLCGEILELFKEKKMSVTKLVHEVLLTFYQNCFTLDQVLDDIKSGVTNKHPKVRQDTLTWLIECVKFEPKQKTLNKCTVSLYEIVMKVSEEGNSSVRTNAQILAGKLIGITRNKTCIASMRKGMQSNARVFKKIEEEASKLGLSSTDDGTEDTDVDMVDASEAAPVQSRSRSKRPSGKPKHKSSKSKAKSKSVASRQPRGAKPAGPRPSTGTRPSTGPSAASTAAASDWGEDTLSGPAPMDFEEAKEQIYELFDEETFTLLETSKKWIERRDSLDKFAAKLDEMDSSFDPHCTALFSYLNTKPGFKDGNVNINKSLWPIIAKMVDVCESFPSSYMAVFMTTLLNKLGDFKYKKLASEVLDNLCEAFGPKLVVAQCLKRIVEEKDIKSPKNIAAFLEWLSSCVDTFGVAAFNPAALVVRVRVFFSNSNKMVRDSCSLVYVSIVKQSGTLLCDMMFETLKPSAVSDLQKRFDGIPEDERGLAPTRSIRGEDAPKQMDLDELVPKTDISASITSKMMDNLCDEKDWKSRKKALSEIASVLNNAGSRIAPDLGDLPSNLRARLSDSNSLLVKQALRILTDIAQKMGPPVKRHAKAVLPGMFSALSNSNKAVQVAAKIAVDAWMNEIGLSQAIRCLPKALEVAVSRPILLQLVVDHHKAGQCEMGDMVKPILACIQDRTKATRSLAEKVLELIIEEVGFPIVNDRVKVLKKAVRLQLAPIMAKYSGSSGGGGGGGSLAAPSETSSARATRGPSSSPRLRRPKSRLSQPQRVGRKRSSAVEKTEKAPPEASDSVSLIRKTNQKAARLRKPRRYKRTFEDWRGDELEDLTLKLRSVLSDELEKLFFARDFQKHAKAMKMIDSRLDDIKDAVISQLDLLFQWLSWRLSSGQTAIFISELSLLSHIVKVLQTEGVKLHQREADSLIPFLIEKVLGHGKTAFRVQTKALLRDLWQVSEIPAMFLYLLDGARSKNTRVCAESLEQFTEMVREFGFQATAHKKDVNFVSKLVDSADSKIRTAALESLAALYELGAGQNLWKCMPKSRMSTKQLSLIETRLRRCKTGISPLHTTENEPEQQDADTEMRTSGDETSPELESKVQVAKTSQRLQAPTSATSTTSSTESKPGDNLSISSVETELPSVFRLNLDSLSSRNSVGMAKTTSTAQSAIFGMESSSLGFGFGPVASTSSVGAVRSKPIESPILSTSSSIRPTSNSSAADPGPRTLPEFLEKLRTGDQADRTLQLHRLWNAFNGGALGASDAVGLANELFGTLTHQISEALNGVPSQSDFRLAKWAVNSLMQLCKDKTLLQRLDRGVLEDLLRELCFALVTPVVKENKTAKSFLHALNFLALKVLQFSDRSAVFFVLIKLLKNHIADEKMAPPNGLFGPTFTRLIVKCLSKVMTLLDSDSSHDINIPFILRAVHEFFIKHHPSCSEEGSRHPIDAVKAVLKKLVSTCGERIRPFILEYEPRAYVRECALAMLDSSGQPRESDFPSQTSSPPRTFSAPTTNQTATQDSSRSNALSAIRARMKSAHSGTSNGECARAAGSDSATTDDDDEGRRQVDENELSVELKRLVAELQLKKKHHGALEVLKALVVKYPQLDVGPYMSGCSPVFKRYVLSAVKLARSESEGGSNGSSSSPVRQSSPAVSPAVSPVLPPTHSAARSPARASSHSLAALRARVAGPSSSSAGGSGGQFDISSIRARMNSPAKPRLSTTTFEPERSTSSGNERTNTVAERTNTGMQNQGDVQMRDIEMEPSSSSPEQRSSSAMDSIRERFKSIKR
eukprot:91264_1